MSFMNTGLVLFNSVLPESDGGNAGAVNALYRTDGTVSGTALVADFTEPSFGLPAGIDELQFEFVLPFGDEVVFLIEYDVGSAYAGTALGFSDGTLSGTTLFHEGEASPFGPVYVPVDARLDEFVQSGDTLLLDFNQPGDPDQLVALSPGGAPTVFDTDDFVATATEAEDLIGNGDGLFAASFKAPSGNTLVITDGTVGGTHTIATSGFDARPDDSAAWVGNTFIYHSSTTEELVAVNYASPGAETRIDVGSALGELTAVVGGVAFETNTAPFGGEPYFWDLTSPSPKLIDDLNDGGNGSRPESFFNLGEDLFFFKNHGEEALYRWDGDGPPEMIATGLFEDLERTFPIPDADVALLQTATGIFQTDGASVDLYESFFFGDASGDGQSDFYLAGEAVLFSASGNGVYIMDPADGLPATKLLDFLGVAEETGRSHFAMIRPISNVINGVEIIGTAGKDIIKDGRTVPGQLLPTDQEDTIYGKKGADIIDGLGGNDMLYGNRGRDKLRGSDGDDVLTGGRKKDILVGGADDDYFVLDDLKHYDKLKDFVVGEDMIVLDSATFTQLAPGALGDFNFARKKPQDADDHVIFKAKSGKADKLFYDNNGDAKGGRDLIAKFKGDVDVSANDFLVI